MSNRMVLSKLLKDNNFVVSRNRLTKYNFSGQQINSYLKNNLLVSIDKGKGIYASPNYLEDPYYVSQLRIKKGIISLSTALYLYGFSDRVPDKIDLTVPRGYKNSALKDEFVLHQQDLKFYKLGIEERKSPQDHLIKIYSLDRTMAEILRPRNHIDSEIINSAFKQYIQSSKKNIAKLMYFAGLFRTTTKVQTYLEVLL